MSDSSLPKRLRDLVIVHSSDIHVDDGYTERLHGGDGTAGLRVVLEAARAAEADVVLLAGDIFEHNRLPSALVERAARLLGEAGRPVVILPGNHDPALQDGVYRRGGMAEIPEVSVLGINAEESVVFAEHDLEIWGHAHRSYDDMEPLRDPRPRRTRWQVAVAHGHYLPVADRSVRPRPAWLLDDEDIAATAVDYLALGHWNRPIRVGAGAVPAYYSGAPELAGTVNEVRLGGDGVVTVTRRPLVW